jgi:hypothetical protein
VDDAATGVRLAGSATGTRIDGATVTGGRIGLAVGGADATLAGLAVAAARVGISATADHATVTGGTVTGAAIGVSIRANRVSVAGLSVTDSTVGFRQSGGAGGRAATFSIDGARVNRVGVGLHLDGRATVANTTVADAREAVQVGPGGQVQLTNDVVGAHVLGLRIAPSGHVTLTDCTVSAPLGARGNVRLVGHTVFPALPLRWLGMFGLVALTAAALLEIARRLRENRYDGRVLAPAHVTNTT